MKMIDSLAKLYSSFKMKLTDKRCKVAVRWLLAIVLTPVYFFTLSLLAFPFLITRKVVSHLANLFRKDIFYQILPTISSLLATDCLQCPTLTQVCVEIYEGPVDVKNLLKNANILLSLVPETKCFIDQWLGFSFWCYDKKFNVANHIHYYNQQNPGEPVDDDKLRQIRNDYLKKAFHKKKSPWEICIVRNYVPNDVKRLDGVSYSAVVFRFHHAMADGISIVKSFDEMLFRPDLVKKVPSPPKIVEKEPFQKIFLYYFKLMVICPYVFMYNRLRGIHDRNEWKLPYSKYLKTYYASKRLVVPLKMIQDIRKSLDVSFTSVLLSAYGGGIKKLMIKQNHTTPEAMTTIVPVQVPGHPNGRMSNHLGTALISIPMNESDPFLRTQSISNTIKGLKNSPLIFLGLMVAKLVSCLPHPFLRALYKESFATAFLSNFNLYQSPVKKLGLNVIETSLTGGLCPAPFSSGLFIISHWDKLFLVVVADKGVLKAGDEVELLMTYIQEELDCLKNYSNV